MSISLEKHPRFQKEYTDWQQKIAEVNDLKIKTELEHQLSALMQEVKRLDSAHSNIMSNNTIPDAVNDSRNSLTQLRKKITKTLQDYEKSIKQSGNP